VAKNYLKAAEVEELNRIVVMFLDYAEDQVKRRRQLTLADWRTNAARFLEFNERNVLKHSGAVSHKDMKNVTEKRYAEFDEHRQAGEVRQADAEDVTELEAAEKKLLEKPDKPK
jgi:hypothetical protein